MTPKERARLRGLANGIDTVLQIGKDGIGETLIHQADITLETRELIKGRVLDTCMDHTPRTAAETLAQATNSEVVQVIGSKFVLYRKKKPLPKRETGRTEPPRKRNQFARKTDSSGKRVRPPESSGHRERTGTASKKYAPKAESFGGASQHPPRNGDTFRKRNPRNGGASQRQNPRNGNAFQQHTPRNSDASQQRNPRNSNTSQRRNSRNGDFARQHNSRNRPAKSYPKTRK